MVLAVPRHNGTLGLQERHLYRKLWLIGIILCLFFSLRPSNSARARQNVAGLSPLPLPISVWNDY